MSTPTRPAAWSHDVHRLFGRLLLLPAYTVAAINGHAFAGGAMLSCACDVRVMRDDRGYWCLPEVDLGLPLTVPMKEVVTVRLPRAAAYDAIMTGRRYSAAEAHAIGIVDHVAAEERVVDLAVELAAVMAPKDRSVIAEHKRMLVRARGGHLRVADMTDRSAHTTDGDDMPSVVRAAADVRSGRRPALDLVEDCLARIEERNAELNAFVFVDRDGATACR